MRTIYTIAIFLSAALLFAIQPMVGKMVLPKLGGSPSVWNTCMVFFQALLLVGYGYAHILTRKVSVKGQMVIHSALLLAALFTLPIALPHILPTRPDLAGLPAGETLSIILWLTMILGLTAGVPFLILSATAPLLQSWFSKTTHEQAKDPYFLYAASNAGSILGLVSYPLIVEPFIGVTDQGRLWSVGYGLLALVLIAAAVTAAKFLVGADPTRLENSTTNAPQSTAPKSAPTRRDRIRWVLLALVPSSVSLGVTQYLSTDIAAVPLLWVAPLLIYLLSFIFAFSRKGVNVELWGRILALSCCVIAFPLLSGAKTPTAAIIAMHLFVLLAAAMTCHGRLARERPSTEHLTEYYFLMSLGGMLGGVANAILAPIFLPIVFEYQLALVASVLLRPRVLGRKLSASATKPDTSISAPIATDSAAPPSSNASAPVDVSAPVELYDAPRNNPLFDVASLAALVMVIASTNWVVQNAPKWFGQPLTEWQIQGILSGVPAIACAFLLIGGGRWRFAIGLAILFISGPLRTYSDDVHVIYTERTFFGMYRVFQHKDKSFHTLYHGTTIHGVEARYQLPNLIPATYYHPTGPIGQLLTEDALGDRLKNVAAIGLGTGTLALYNEPGCTMRFIEIDPAVVRIAANPEWFSYLKLAKGDITINAGDGRLEMDLMPDKSFGIIILDAFSSDAIPTHLLTREAMAIYRKKLQPGGLIAIHISNVYFNLEPVVANLAADMGMVARVQHDSITKKQQDKEAKSASVWCILSSKDSDLGPIAKDGRWLVLKPNPKDAVWTDDYTNVLKIMSWK